MKKVSIWGVGVLIALGFIAYLLASQASWADSIGGSGQSQTGDGSGTGSRKAVGFDQSKVGVPGDVMPDILPDRPGRDSDRDRHPDATPDRVLDNAPDCVANISGAGGDRRKGCSADGGDSGDSIPENQYTDGFSNISGNTLADGSPVNDGVPDAVRNMNINRALEGGNNDIGGHSSLAPDYTPDWKYSDTYLAKTGGKLSIGDQTPDSHNNTPPVTVPPTPPGSDVRAHDGVGDSLTSGPDILKYGSGPSDRKNDESPDIAGLGTRAGGGGGGGGGCSLVAGQSADPASGLAYLLVLLAPAAVVVIRRTLRRK